MAHEHLAGKTDVLLEPFCILHFLWILLLDIDKLSLHIFKNFRHCLRTHRPIPANVAVTGLHVQLDGGNTGTILAPVMLLLHQQIQLVQAV